MKYIKRDMLIDAHNINNVYKDEFDKLLVINVIHNGLSLRTEYIVLTRYLRLFIFEYKDIKDFYETGHINGRLITGKRKIYNITDTYDTYEKYKEQRYILLSNNVNKKLLAFDLLEDKIVIISEHEIRINITDFFNVDIDVINNKIKANKNIFLDSGNLSNIHDKYCEMHKYIVKQAMISTNDKMIFIIDTNTGHIKLLQYKGDDENIIIPDFVDIIGENAFKSNLKIKTVVLGKNVIEIEQYAFSKCNNLNKVKTNTNLEYIGFSAFNNCPKLEKIELYDRDIDISGGAFEPTCKIEFI